MSAMKARQTNYEKEPLNGALSAPLSQYSQQADGVSTRTLLHIKAELEKEILVSRKPQNRDNVDKLSMLCGRVNEMYGINIKIKF